MCGRYYIDSDIADELEKVVNNIDQRIRQGHFACDICPTNVTTITEKSEHGMKLDIRYLMEKIWSSMPEWKLSWTNWLFGMESNITEF